MDRKDLLKRFKLKGITKLICTLDEKWNNWEKLTGLFNIEIYCLEIYSEIDSEIQKQLI